MNSERDFWKIKKKNMTRYNESSKVYDVMYREEQAKKYRATLDATNIQESEYVLDLGCGSGLLIEEVGDSRNQIVCVDFSKNMIMKAMLASRSAFILADADYLPFKEDAFDHIFSFTLLQNMPSPEKTLAEISRVAKLSSLITLSVIKKGLGRGQFLHLLRGKGFSVIKLIDEEKLQDYIAVCSRGR